MDIRIILFTLLALFVFKSCIYEDLVEGVDDKEDTDAMDARLSSYVDCNDEAYETYRKNMNRETSSKSLEYSIALRNYDKILCIEDYIKSATG